MKFRLPLKYLLPYQRRWVADTARFKIGCWARQTGKSFSCAVEAVHSCLTEKTLWVVLSVGERQALEFLHKAREWAEAFHFAVTDYAEDRRSPEAVATSAQITFPNGSRIIAIPARPETARGYSGNLILDEFAHHDNADRVWKAIYPSISNSLRGEKQVRIVSTPGGCNNKFARLWKDKDNLYSKHFINIHDAKAQGLAVDVDALRKGLDDAGAWAQEYECEFADSASVFFPYDLIERCESEQATEHLAEGFWNRTGGNDEEDIVLGIDFGRSRNMTVCWALAVGACGMLTTREVLVLANMPTPQQLEILLPRVQRASRVCVDYTGPGIGLGDFLAETAGRFVPEENEAGKIELCTFTPMFKAALFPALKAQLEAGRILIPHSRETREDLHNVQRVVSRAGTLSYTARQTPDGHSDRTTALALANRAAQFARSEWGAAIVHTRLHRECRILAAQPNPFLKP